MTDGDKAKILESLKKNDLFVTALSRARDDSEREKIESYAVAMLGQFSRFVSLVSGSLNVVKRESDER